jgi:putative transposase
MTVEATAQGAGHVRYTFRVRLSSTAGRQLEAEWDRCRWLWNECVAKSKQTHQAARMTERMMARRKPKRGQAASKGYREAKRQTAKLHRKIADRRQDTGRKWAKRVVADHDAIAVEDFRPTFLARTTMARKHGRIVHLVHPAYTTMDCAQCGARTKHALPLSERTYSCTACGFASP